MTNQSASAAPRRRSGLLVGAAALGAAGLLGAGAFAAFSDTESTSASIATGELDLLLAGSISVVDFAPGDTAARTLDVTVDGQGDLVEFIEISLSDDVADGFNEVLGQERDDGVAVGPQGSLWSDDVLSMSIDGCDQAWSGDAISGYSCSGTETALMASAPIDDLAGTALTLDAADLGVTATADGTIPDGTSLYLLTNVEFDSAAGNEYEMAELDVPVTVTAIQRAGLPR